MKGGGRVLIFRLTMKLKMWTENVVAYSMGLNFGAVFNCAQRAASNW